MQSLQELNLHDIAGLDCDVWLSKHEKFGINIEVETEEKKLFIQEGMHPYAAESLADFCTRYLAAYNKINKD